MFVNFINCKESQRIWLNFLFFYIIDLDINSHPEKYDEERKKKKEDLY